MTTHKSATDVKIDFHADFRQFVEQVLVNNAIEIDPAEPYGEAVYRYYSNARRRLHVQRYRVVEAKELTCPPDLAPGYAELKSELEQGLDVTARLSRRTSKATYEDPLLNDWGIIHFHLGLRDAQGNVPGTNVVLFAFVRGDVVHCIGFFDHGSWSKIEVLEILQRNWPHAIEHARAKGVIGVDYEVTDEDRARLRAAGAATLNVVNGVVYGPVGGGYTTAKTSMIVHKQADRAVLSVDVYEKHVRENIVAIVRDFKAAGRIVGTPPTFHLGFHADGRAIATEPTAEASFILGPFPL
jgi:hypothetical protein